MSEKKLWGVKKLTPEQRDEAVKRYLAGASLGRLAQSYGISTNAIRNFLVAQGIAIRSTFKANRTFGVRFHARRSQD